MRFRKTNLSRGMYNSEVTTNNLAEYLKLPSNSTGLLKLTEFLKINAEENMSSKQSDKIQGLANFVNQIQLTLNQHMETLREHRKEERQEAADIRRDDNLSLAIKSFGMLIGFFICVFIIGALFIWIRNRCKKSNRANRQREIEMAEIKKRLKAIEEGGDE